MRFPLQLSVAVAVLASAATAEGQMRFQGMDTNGDGVITRREWRGNDTSFKNQDWNGDGILSGDEVRTGARRQTGWNEDWNRDGRVDNVDSQMAQRFFGYDTNGDSRVGRSEWNGDARLFSRLDANRDGYLSMEEYTQGGGFALDAVGGPSYRFSSMDANNDGAITRSEWNMSRDDFNRLDVNRDNRISRFEFENNTGVSDDYPNSRTQFNAFDANRDGWLTRSEMRMSAYQFDRFDANQDNRISRQEFDSVATSQPQEERNATWRSGYERGLVEGRAAGREDFTRRQGWDLEGQRELERADSGYTPQAGRLSDYQAGYREGFRNAYRGGFIEAGGRAPR